MTYLQFHLVFILPPIALLAVLLARGGPIPGVTPRRAGWSLAALVVIALVWTTPWDNYLVWRGVWDYGLDRVTATIGYVPVEEYLFFVLQPILTGSWLYVVLRRVGSSPFSARGTTATHGPAHQLPSTRSSVADAERSFGADDVGSESTGTGPLRLVVASLWLVVAVVGLVMLGHEPTVYMGLILVWAAPVLSGQWFYAGGVFLRRGGTYLLAVSVPTLYLWIADRIALALGIWRISDRYTTGLNLAGLPVEEALFFLMTNLLVVQGLLMFVHPPARKRAGTMI